MASVGLGQGDQPLIHGQIGHLGVGRVEQQGMEAAVQAVQDADRTPGHLGHDGQAVPVGLVEALQRQGDVWVAPARVDGKVCLRPCVVNYRTTDDDVRAFVEAVLEVGRDLR